MLKVHLAGDTPDLAHPVERNRHLRTARPPFVSYEPARLQFGADGHSATVPDLMDFLTRGLVSNATPVQGDLARFVAELAVDGEERYSGTEEAYIYGERCRLVSCTCLGDREDWSLLPTGPFASTRDRLLFEHATCVGVGASLSEPEWVPSSDYAENLRENHQFGPWECWRGMALKDAVVFLAARSGHFMKEVLPHNIESEYPPLYLYTPYQRMQLYVLSNNLMREGADLNLRELRELMDRVVEFRNRYWFAEMTRKPLGGELYRRFQHGLEVCSLYEMVSSEVHDLQSHYEKRAADRTNMLLNWVTFAFFPLTALTGLFGTTFFTGSWPAFLLSCVAAGALSWGVWWRWGRR